MKPEYNSLKKRVLKALVDYGDWISVKEIARKVNLGYPERGLYSYLRRLEAIRLVEVDRRHHARLLYRPTERGATRLKFLSERR